MTGAEIAAIYERLPLAEREAIAAQFADALAGLKKRRSRANP